MSRLAHERTVCAFAPGRTEIAGNHTDHQGGRVIAAAVSCGVEIVLRENAAGRIRLISEGFAPVEIEVGDWNAREGERFTTAALVRGVACGMAAEGADLRGFDAQVRSTVPPGGGLSSSAAFELALAAGLDVMFAGGSVSDERRVLVAQEAERSWFGKPCGLMDQLSVQLGGMNAIDFGGDMRECDAACLTDTPWRSERIDFDFERAGYALCLVDTHSDHSSFTREYAQVALDMEAVARFFGARGLSQVAEEEFFADFEDVRRKLGDLPALRGLHYYRETSLVNAREAALRAGDIGAFLEATRRSGASSAQYLQNVSCAGHLAQPAMVTLALADTLLEDEGACRIHGGGFGGSIQAFVPLDRYDAFASGIDAHLGEGSCARFHICAKGAHALWD